MSVNAQSSVQSRKGGSVADYQTPPAIYGERFFTCSICHKTFKMGMTRCAVIHGLNECCHYGDKEVSILENKSDE